MSKTIRELIDQEVAEAVAEARAETRAETRAEMIRNLILLGAPLSMAAAATGLTEDEVAAIAYPMANELE